MQAFFILFNTIVRNSLSIKELRGAGRPRARNSLSLSDLRWCSYQNHASNDGNASKNNGDECRQRDED